MVMMAALSEMGQRRLAGDNLGPHVDVEERVDVGKRDVLEFGDPKDPRIVDEDVEPAERRDRLFNRSLNGGAVGAVGLDRNGLAPRGLDGRDDFRRAVGRFLVSDRHIRAFGGQRLGDRRADASACARDQRPFSRQCHCRLLL